MSLIFDEKPEWLKQAEAADRYNLDASARQGDDGEGPFPIRRTPTSEEVAEYAADMQRWNEIHAARKAAGLPPL